MIKLHHPPLGLMIGQVLQAIEYRASVARASASALEQHPRVGALEGCKTPVTIGPESYEGGLVFDSRVYAPLSDVAPVELADSDSPLQHMAVVRDFFVPR